MTTLDIRVDDRALQKAMRRLGQAGVGRAASAALNRTAANVQKAGIKIARKEMGLARASDIGKSVTYRRGGQYVSIKAASPRRLAALIKGSGRPLNLIRFNARQTKRGVSHRAYGRRQTAEGAFIGNSGRTVFVRKGRKRSAGVRPAWGPGLANVYAAHAKELRTLADKQYRAVHFPSRIRQELRRAGLLRGSSVA